MFVIHPALIIIADTMNLIFEEAYSGFDIRVDGFVLVIVHTFTIFYVIYVKAYRGRCERKKGGNYGFWVLKSIYQRSARLTPLPDLLDEKFLPGTDVVVFGLPGCIVVEAVLLTDVDPVTVGNSTGVVGDVETVDVIAVRSTIPKPITNTVIMSRGEDERGTFIVLNPFFKSWYCYNFDIHI